VTGSRRLAGAQQIMPACAVPLGSFVYDPVSCMWVEVVDVTTENGRTRILVIDGHDVPLDFDADESIAVCDAFTLHR
jgi:hypothetical protein